MITFGLTGGIASGKSTITRTFRDHGIPIVDADVIARQVVAPGSEGLDKILDTFGRQYLNSEFGLDRPALGNLVFSNPVAMAKLTLIMKPLIENEAARQIERYHNNNSNSNNSIVGYDAALIIESGNAEKYRPLIVVSCTKEIQLERLVRRDNVTKEHALDRINAQLPIEVKVKYANYIINTCGTVEDTRLQTFSIIQEFRHTDRI